MAGPERMAQNAQIVVLPTTLHQLSAQVMRRFAKKSFSHAEMQLIFAEYKVCISMLIRLLLTV
jgi:hypothetical protein